MPYRIISEYRIIPYRISFHTKFLKQWIYSYYVISIFLKNIKLTNLRSIIKAESENYEKRKMINWLPSHSQKILQEAICFLWVPINNFGH